VVVDGAVTHSGGIPAREKIVRWLPNEFTLGGRRLFQPVPYSVRS
jgi:hypothetical protein